MSRQSILVVEDEHTLLKLLEYRLGKHYEVHTASNGEKALERIEEKIPDLIVSDIMMPRMDGFELQAALQQRKDTETVPFIFLTAKSDEESRLKGMRTGVDDYITKPFDIEQLLARIDRLLKRTQTFQNKLGGRIGKDFSKKLMPKSLPEEDRYQIYFYNNPRAHGGGDLFDWSRPSNESYFFTVGDVMGKGVQAKFYAFSFLSYVRGTLHTMLPSSKSPAALLQRLNQLLIKDEVMEETFASLLLIRWEPEQNTITYANAGHCRPVLVGPDQAEVVAESDLILGLDEEAEFHDATLELPAGSALVAYTDGLMEQQRPDGKMIGEEGVADACWRTYQKKTPDPIETLTDTILAESKEDEFADDILVFWLGRER